MSLGQESVTPSNTNTVRKKKTTKRKKLNNSAIGR
jgi:hypothetical protein